MSNNDTENSNYINSYNSKKVPSEKDNSKPVQKTKYFLINSNNLNFSTKDSLHDKELYRNNLELEKKYTQILQRKKRKKIIAKENITESTSISQIKPEYKTIDISLNINKNKNLTVNNSYDREFRLLNTPHTTELMNSCNSISNGELSKEESIAINKKKFIKIKSIPRGQKIKEKQKQNIEFMIESQMKAELLNYKNMEKDRKLKENKEKKKKEWTEKNLKNQRIQEDMKQKRLINIETMMKKREDKITIKHEKIDKRINEMKETKNKKREDFMKKQTEHLIKVSNNKSEIDIFRQKQEKLLIEQKLNNDEKEKKMIERLKKMQNQIKLMNSKRREKSAELLLRNHEKKEEQLNQLIQKINQKREENYKKLQEHYKELEKKAKLLKANNQKKRDIKDNLIKSMEAQRQKKIDEYFKENEKKEQNVIISKMKNKQKVLSQKMHEDEFLELVQGHKHELELEHAQKKLDLKNRMDDMDQRILNYKKEEEVKSLKKKQESFAKQVEKNFVNKRTHKELLQENGITPKKKTKFFFRKYFKYK